MARRRSLRVFPFGPSSAARALAEAEIRENADGTFDLIGVELLSVGGPIHGVGSPPEGDFWSLEELRAMAEADAELGDEVLPPNKIGHPDEQTMVSNSIDAGDLPDPKEGELPAVGWLEDLRLEGQKLLGDVMHVPKVVKDLIELGAYRTRSVELSKVTSQKTGKTYDWVVTGLAWLGGKMPAVKTLGDVVSLYQGDVPIRRVFVDQRDYAPGDIVWNPRLSLGALRADLQEALNGPGSPGFVEPRWYVRDVSIDYRALVEDWAAISPDEFDAYVFTFSIDDAGTVTVPAAADWTKAEQTWIETAKDYDDAAALTFRARSADTGAMKFSAKQRRTFAEATGLEESKVTDTMLEAAGVQPEGSEGSEPEPTPAPEPAPEPTPAPEPEVAGDGEETKALQARIAALETENHQKDRKSFVDQAVREAKIAPGQRESLETLYDRDASAARKFVDELEPREDLRSELGSEDDVDLDERELEEQERVYSDDASGRLGIAKDKIV